jgi:hypothetical protein
MVRSQTPEFVISEDIITSIAKTYNVLGYTHILRKLVAATGLNPDSLSKKDLHEKLNDVIITNYKGEVTAKALLVDMFKKKNVVAAFEIKVNNSRVDFLTVNGETRSYEIKSELDNLSKLSKQVSDYSHVFEYNYIVLDEKHYPIALNMLPETYGIISLKNGKLSVIKEAIKNTTINPENQLRLFTKKERTIHFKEQQGCFDKILLECTSERINEALKKMLKKRYEAQWSFLKNNINDIFKIDYQYFFYHNISPDLIYQSI